MPVNKQGSSGKASEIDTARAIEWLIERAADAAGGKKNNFDADRARKMAADADRAEMETAALRGDLVEVDVAASLVADRLQTLRTRALNLPSKVAVKMAATRTREEAMDILEKEISNLLTEMANVGAD